MRRADPEHVIRDVGRRISEVREASGRTQEDVAGALDIGVRNYQRIEWGEQNLTIATIVRIANELRVRPAELWEAPRTTRRGRGRPPRRTAS